MRPGLHVDAFRTHNGLWTGCVRSDGFGKPTYIRPRKGFPSEAEARAYGQRVLSALRAEAEKYKRDRAQDETAEANEHHRLLGLPASCSRVDILRAFRQKAQEHHPDLGGDPAEFRRIVAAKELLLKQLPHAA